MSVLVAGSVALDSIHTTTEQHNELLGGSAAYASIAAALSGPVRVCAIVGTDFPEEHTALLKSKSVDLSDVEIVEGRTFRWTGLYHEDMNHRETLDVSIDVLEKFNPRLTPEAAAAKVVLLANMSPDNQLAVLGQCAAKPFVILDSMDLWINIARAGLVELMSKVDLFVINEDEARIFTECKNLVTAGHKLREMGPKYVVVKKGEHGALLFGEGRFFSTCAYPLQGVADPTGAGDSFAGGMIGHLASLGQDSYSFEDLSRAVVYGGVLASFTCEAFGVAGLAGVTAEKLKTRLEEFRGYTAC